MNRNACRNLLRKLLDTCLWHVTGFSGKSIFGRCPQKRTRSAQDLNPIKHLLAVVCVDVVLTGGGREVDAEVLVRRVLHEGLWKAQGLLQVDPACRIGILKGAIKTL